MAKVLFVRYDRLGDFLLTLPSEMNWKRKFPQDEVHWVVTPIVSFLLDRLNPPHDRFIVIPPSHRFFEKLKTAKELASQLRKKKFDKAFVFFAPWWIALAIFSAGIPMRVGVASKIWAWLFYNQPVRQKRSRALFHEAQYNLQLLSQTSGIDPELEPYSLRILEQDIYIAKELLNASGIKEPYVVIHPGMGGSALNWPPLHYRELALRLRNQGIEVVVTGTRGDREFINETGIERIPGVRSFVEKTPGNTILGILKQAQAVVCPSTGIAHLAAAVLKLRRMQ